jgi:energy-coupling factor transporter ATP-binding protein EcfA2
MLSNSMPYALKIGLGSAVKARVALSKTGQDTTAKVIAQLRRARDELERFRTVFPGLAPAIRALQRIEIRLDRPLRVAITGEFNSGKSSLANLMVGIDSLPTAVVSNSRIPTLLYYAERPEIFAVLSHSVRMPIRADRPMQANSAVRLEVGLPSARLKTAQIIDLPGLADPQFDDGAAELAPHNVDAVLWCTIATQAWKESERLAWRRISTRLRRRGVLVVTHRDLLRDRQDEAKVLLRLHDTAGPEFQDIVMLSTLAGAEPALIGLPDDEHKVARPVSNFDALEVTVDRLLDSIRQARGAEAIEVTNRIAQHALSQLDPVHALVAAQ